MLPYCRASIADELNARKGTRAENFIRSDERQLWQRQEIGVHQPQFVGGTVVFCRSHKVATLE